MTLDEAIKHCEEVANKCKTGHFSERIKAMECSKEHRQLAEWLKELKAYREQSGDVISRQSAIFLASDLKQDLPDDERIADMVMAHNEGILEYQTQLSLLPSVTPQQRTGRWIEQTDDYYGDISYRCSACNEVFCLSDGTLAEYEYCYCPNCGAKMEVEEC